MPWALFIHNINYNQIVKKTLPNTKNLVVKGLKILRLISAIGILVISLLPMVGLLSFTKGMKLV
jgi:hypothetical protein